MADATVFQELVDNTSTIMWHTIQNLLKDEDKRSTDQARANAWREATERLQTYLAVIHSSKHSTRHVPLFCVACDIEISASKGTRWPHFNTMLRQDVRSQRDHPWLQIFCPQRRKTEVDRLDYDFAKDILGSEGTGKNSVRGQSCQPETPATDKCEACQAAGVVCDPIPGCACAQCKRWKRRCSMAKKRKRSLSAAPDSRQGSDHIEVYLALKETQKELYQTPAEASKSQSALLDKAKASTTFLANSSEKASEACNRYDKKIAALERRLEATERDVAALERTLLPPCPIPAGFLSVSPPSPSGPGRHNLPS